MVVLQQPGGDCQIVGQFHGLAPGKVRRADLGVGIFSTQSSPRREGTEKQAHLIVEADRVGTDVAMGPASRVQLADLLRQLANRQQAVHQRPRGELTELLGQPPSDFKIGCFVNHRTTPSRPDLTRHLGSLNGLARFWSAAPRL